MLLMTLDLFKALEDDALEMRGLNDTRLYHCYQPDETYTKQWELDREDPGVTVIVINLGATVMCEYMCHTVGYSILNSAVV